ITKDELEMMRRTNEPSQKIKLQSIIRKILQDRPGITTEEFIKTLRNNKINVLFNQASTGYVSGISYDYGGVIIKGAKLGNDFKWSSIKSRIYYDQERDREVIRHINERVKSGHINAKSTQRIDNLQTHIPESSKNLIPLSPIDSHSLEDLIRADHQPDFDIERVLKLRKKKKRRNLRR